MQINSVFEEAVFLYWNIFDMTAEVVFVVSDDAGDLNIFGDYDLRILGMSSIKPEFLVKPITDSDFVNSTFAPFDSFYVWGLYISLVIL